MREAVIVATARTPIGKAYRGAFNDTEAQALGGHVIAEALRTKVWPLLEAGLCKPIIDSVFSLAEVVKAHERIDGGEHVGKIVLTV